jgi:hypothetical protein
VSDYGEVIDTYLKQLQQENAITKDYLSCHKVNGVYRAKMVDWMVEVLGAFKCADQTFFLAVSLMDRYFDALAKQGVSIELHELHLIGVVCMFMASKYEDVYPLLLRTVFSKIGHGKICEAAIRAKEADILRALGFCVGSAPTSLEFIQPYAHQLLANHEDK